MRATSFPRRTLRSKPRSRTLPDSGDITWLPLVSPKPRQLKPPHFYYNLNHLISENKRGLLCKN